MSYLQQSTRITDSHNQFLVGIQTAAVDRYVYRLLEEAGLGRMNYEEARELLNLAADSLEVERVKFDHSIWQYMSQRENPLKRGLLRRSARSIWAFSLN